VTLPVIGRRQTGSWKDDSSKKFLKMYNQTWYRLRLSNKESYVKNVPYVILCLLRSRRRQKCHLRDLMHNWQSCCSFLHHSTFLGVTLSLLYLYFIEHINLFNIILNIISYKFISSPGQHPSHYGVCPPREAGWFGPSPAADAPAHRAAGELAAEGPAAADQAWSDQAA
jgi:hypothetical protein